MINKILLGSAITASIILSGCNSSDTVTDAVTSTTTDTVTSTTGTTGYFVDAAVQNLNYDCVADNNMDQLTTADGAFTCQNMSQVRFRLGNLVLGEISALPADGYVFPQDVAGIDRTNIYDAKVTEMARLLQTCDLDNNLTNGIQIDPEVAASFDINETFDANNTDIYLQTAAQNQHQIRTQTEAQAHLHATFQTVNTATAMATGTAAGAAGANAGTNMIDVNTLPVSELTDEVRETIEYMVNEEKLAYDVYMNLYSYHAANGTELFQFQNIAERSETMHMELVEELAAKYTIDKASDLPSGEFSVPAVQSLYDVLYAKGITTPQDALEAGCMVEVTDINDLNADIALAESINADDVVAVYTVLRDGSYNHYWSFDQGLKNMGVTEGCCAVGTVDGVDYCHPEYPQNANRGPKRP